MSAQVADVNGDGKPDILVDSLCASVSCSGTVLGVLLGNGDGTFQAAATFDTSSAGGRLVVGDLNGDGKLDVVLTASIGVGVVLGNGDGTFQPVVTYRTGGVQPLSVAIGDVDHDGKPDLVVAIQCVDGFCNSGIMGVLLGNGDGSFQSAVTYPSGGENAIWVALADVNGDGNLDILVANVSFIFGEGSGGAVGVLLGNGDGTFKPPVTYASGSPLALSLAVGDLNGDGKLDLAVANCTTQQKYSSSCPGRTGIVGVLLGNGDGTFQAATIHPSGGQEASAIAIADVNGDGQLDLVVANTYGESNFDGTVGVLLHKKKTAHPSSISIASSPNPSLFNHPVTFTATVTSAQGVVPDGGLVTFFDLTTAIGIGKTAGGVATFTTSSLTAKVHTIRATYSGDATLNPSTKTLKQTVNKLQSTTVLTSQPNPSAHGAPVTFTATVTWAGPGIPTGRVSFNEGSTRLGSVVLKNGVGTLNYPKLAVGTHPITATYAGDTSALESTSPVVDQVVQ